MKAITSIVCLALIAPLFSGDTLARDREDTIEQGKTAYLIFCSNCHGQDATGNGPVAQLLTVPSNNLTLLKRIGMEEFPFNEVHSAIDGRKDIKTHGYKQMPIWGDAFGRKRAILVNEIIRNMEALQNNP